jgi:hypothetical protein
LLYEGREIYFGSAKAAKLYFQHMGWASENRQTVPEFLTHITDPRNRRAEPGYGDRVPRSAKDFEKHWQNSVEFRVLQEDLKNYDLEVLNTTAQDDFKAARRAAQSRFIWPESSYMVNGPLQLKICLGRAWYRLRHDMTPVITAIVGQTVMALIVGSVFFGTPNTTDGLFAMGSAIFFAVLLSALIALTEVNSLYSQRPIVVKQASYA